MKKSLIILILCFLSYISFGQVKNQVCIVRPNYSDKIMDMIYEFVPRLEKLGVSDPEKYVSDFLNNGFSGSGFVYVAPNGKNYIITNRHVIRDAETSTVIFQEEKTKKQTKIKGLKILASDAELDLAILEFPENQQPFTSSLPFYNGELSDGDTVYTAGYPGLLGNPVWQFGSGIITNSSVEVEEMIKPELSSLIQHSAQIDGGNSGGPLLIKDNNGNYEVAGINTWKLINRQDTNFAIPTATIINFINKSLSNEQTDENITSYDIQNSITEKATILHKSLNKYTVSFEELVDYISINFVENEGKRIFDKVINKCSSDNRKVMNELLEYSPIESVRYAIGWYIFNEFHKDEYITDRSKKSSVKESKLKPINPAEKIEETEDWNTRLLNGETKKILVVTWTYINGNWEILTVKIGKTTKADLNTGNQDSTQTIYLEIPEGTKKLGNTYIYDPLKFQISFGKNLYFDDSQKVPWYHTLDMNIKINNFLTTNISTELVEEYVYIFKYGEKNYFPKLRYLEPCAGLKFQIPFYLNDKIISPYLSLQGGANLSNFNDLQTQIIAKMEIGVGLHKIIGKNTDSIFLDPSFGYKINFNDLDKQVTYLRLSIGMGF